MKIINDNFEPPSMLYVNTTFDPSKGERLSFTKKRSQEGRYSASLVLDTTVATEEDFQLMTDEVSQRIYKLFESVSPDRTIFTLNDKQLKLFREMNTLSRTYGSLTAISMMIARFRSIAEYSENYTEEELMFVMNKFIESKNN